MLPADLALVGITAAVLGVLGLHMLASRRGPAWAGAVAPLLWVVAVGVLIAQGRIEPGRPYVVALAGLVMLLWMWASGRQARAARGQAEPADSLSP